MKHKFSYRVLLPALTLLLVASTTSAQENSQLPSQPMQSNQAPTSDDPIRDLNLTPDQRAEIRSLRQQNQEERASINRRLRDANLALQQALDVDSPDETTLEPLLKQVAELQAAQLRMRVLTEVRIRRVLSPEQRALLRDLRVARRHLRREMQLQNRRRDRLMNRQRNRNRRNTSQSNNSDTRP